MERLATRGAVADTFFRWIHATAVSSVARFILVAGFSALLVFFLARPAFATVSVGATPGAFAVSPSGAATYTIPIVVPPGTNGMAPKLSLTYNSQSGNGLLGMGWSIGGLSVIHRCGATIAIDGFMGGVNYDANDKFCLDGERLIYIGNNEYRTTHESWQRVIASDASMNPLSFAVYGRDGTIRYYGNTTDSRIMAVTPNTTIVRVWAVNLVQNRSGDYYTVSYTQDNTGSYYPFTINYTGNGAVAPYNSIYFQYNGNRVYDPINHYEGGSSIYTVKLLTGIMSCTSTTCFGGGTNQVRQYYLTYDNNGVANRARLKSIQECGSDGVCLPATSFSWYQAPASLIVGPSINTGVTSSTPLSVNVVSDPLGRGLSQLEWVSSDAYGPYSLHLLGQGISGTFGAVYWGSSCAGVACKNLVGDINGDGMSDLIITPTSNNQVGYFLSDLNQGRELNQGNYYSTGWSITTPIPPVAADLNGDGLADLVWASSNNSFSSTLSTGSGFGTPVGSNTGATLTLSNVMPGDFNGDGRSDLLCVQTSGGVSYFSVALFAGTTNTLGAGTSLLPCTATNTQLSGSPTLGPWLVDLNGDGKSDLVWTQNNNIYWVLSNGAGLSPGYPLNIINSTGITQATFADLNGDGQPDFVYLGTDGYIHYHISNDQGWFGVDVNTGIQTSISAGNGPWAVDLNGDGRQDLAWISNGTFYVAMSYGDPIDVLQSVTDGLGVQTSISYKPWSGSVSYTPWGYPYQQVKNGPFVVSSYSQNNGVNTQPNTTSFTYEALQRHLTANASLGFNFVTRTDPNGVTRYTYYNQRLDGTEGTVSEMLTLKGGVLVENVVNGWVAVPESALAANLNIVELQQSTKITYDINTGNQVTQVDTINKYDEGYYVPYENPTTVTVTYSANGTADGWQKVTTNTFNNDATNWFLGQLLTSQVTAYAPGQTPQTRTSSFTYNPSSGPNPGLLLTETIEPNSATLWLKSVYAYDTFGNRTKKTVSGPDIPTRDEYTRQYDARGQFMMWQTNAAGHQTTYNSYDLRNGAVTQFTDPNGLITQWQYQDGFARMTQETRPDNTTTTYTYQGCDNTCPTLAKTMTAIATSSAGTTWVYRDMLGREVRSQRQGLGGAWVYRDTAYDNLGRVVSVSHPYFSGETLHYTTYGYDVLGRVTSVTEPGPAGSCNGPGRTTVTTYNGLSTTVTNPLCQPKTTVKNSQGLAISVTDNAGTTTYTYDPFGNLTRVAKSYDVGADTTMGYDDRGRKTSMYDPDMGSWTYGYNALSELIWQKDAKLQTINMTYDELGRMKTRVLPNSEGTSTWTYDIATYGKGKLQSVSNPSATETYAYDSLSRPSSVTTSISGITYTTSYTYDAYSRPLTLTYPITAFKLYHVYDDYGHLTEVRQDSAAGLLYWQATAFDAHGRLTQETFGDGLISARAYDHATGDLNTIKTGTVANPTAVQNLSYQFDALDNLTSRTDAIMGYTEIFGYDNLNRLITVTGPAPKTYQYAGNGNLTYKSDVGTYTYPTNGVRPHAVTHVAGTLTKNFTYDGNGNLTFDWGRIIAYTAFNKPATIATPNQGTTTLTYDAHDNRLIKTTSSGTTTYIGKLYEKLTSGTTTIHKHHIYAGNNLVATYTSPATLQYFHTDHLGSIEIIIANPYGIVNQRLSYDAHGLRRNIDGTDAASFIPPALTTLGFTGHEHDHNGVELINMNAREYDPVIGRFITPDTIVPGATNSQSYNRYSYALNNPLSRIDPTGQWSLRKAVRSITRAVHRAGETVQRNIHQAGESAGRVFTNVAGNLSRVPYVGGLLTTGFLANPMFGSWYGATTSDWNSVGRATATAGVLAAGVWAAPNLTALQWYGYPTYVGANMVLGYASGYSLAQIYGASGAEARAAGQTGARYAGGFAFLYVGYQELVGRTPLEHEVIKNKGDQYNTFGLIREHASDPIATLTEGSNTMKAVSTIPSFHGISGLHDVFTGTAGFGIRHAIGLGGAIMDIPVLGNIGYNVATMPVAAAWTWGAMASEFGITPALTVSHEGYNPYQAQTNQ